MKIHLCRIFLSLWEIMLMGWSFLEALTAWCQNLLSNRWLTWPISMMFMLALVTGLNIPFAKVHQVSKTMCRSGHLIIIIIVVAVVVWWIFVSNCWSSDLVTWLISLLLTGMQGIGVWHSWAECGFPWSSWRNPFEICSLGQKWWSQS